MHSTTNHLPPLFALTGPLFILVGASLTPARGRASLVVALMFFLLGTTCLLVVQQFT